MKARADVVTASLVCDISRYTHIMYYAVTSVHLPVNCALKAEGRREHTNVKRGEGNEENEEELLFLWTRSSLTAKDFLFDDSYSESN